MAVRRGQAIGWLLLFSAAVVAVLAAKEKKKIDSVEDDLKASETRYGYGDNPFFSLLYNYNQKPQPSYVSYPLQRPASYQYLPAAKRPAQHGCGKYAGPACARAARYRSYDGSCNNYNHPSWGMANTKYERLLPANYADNVHSPPVARSGDALPNPRTISYTLFPDIDIQDKKWTLVAMQWGQIMTHDMAMIDGSTQSKGHAATCCSEQGQLIQEALSSPLCFPIIVPPHDPVYAYAGQRCRNFVRSTTDLDRGCSSPYKPAEQLTVVSHFLDLSLIYGSSDSVASGLRAGVGGRLIVDVRGNREWLPPAANKTGACDVHAEAEVCYASGDARVNQNPQLTVLHLMLHREHNRVANELARLNPHWSDETIYQEARRINCAINQQISYYEWLPIFIGEQNSLNRKIIFKTEGWVNDYDPEVNPSVINEHSTAAFRYFHSLIAGRLLLVGEQRYAYSYNALRLSDHFNRPGIIEENGNLDKLTRGMSFQPEEASDQWFDREITNFLFRHHHRLGDDLRAIDIQRNRDHGLATYNDMRVVAGLPKAYEWNDYADLISPENIQKLAQLYEHPDDVDLAVGGSLERHVEGTLVGPTFLNILSEQFWRTRVGDRFWFETGDPEVAFTIEQLAELRKASISRLFCDNGDNIQYMQPRGFEILSETNPLMRCSDLPAIDLSYWMDVQTPERSWPASSPFSWAKK